MEDDPYYNRRLGNTPANKFSIKYSFILLGISAAIGVGYHFLMTYLKPENPKNRLQKLDDFIEHQRNLVTASLLPNCNSGLDDKNEKEKNFKQMNKKSLKRKKDLLDQTTNDFEDEQLNFRYPKRTLVESSTSSTNESKRRGRSKKSSSLKSGNTQRSSFSQSSALIYGTKDQNIVVNSQKGTNTSCTTAVCEDITSIYSSGQNSPSHSKDEEFSDLSELEKSVCSSVEKLCPTCKCIVLVEEYPGHVSTCLKRFSYSKNEKENQAEKSSRILFCPVCLKSFTSPLEKHSHVKICGLNHGLSTEQLILAARLQEKQDEERVALGLPSPQLLQEASGIRKKSVPRTGNKNSSDPDMELAYALSRSLAEEERIKREREEDKLVSLGLHDVVQENRRKLVLPQPPPLPLSGKGSRLGKGKKKKEVIQTPLMTRTKEERERIITEKVAAILTGEMDFGIACQDTNRPLRTTDRLPCSLNLWEDEESTLWNFAGTGMEVPLESYFVPEFEDYIKPQVIPVGELLKSFSKVPGRLNYTALVEDSDEEGGDSDNGEGIETTIVDAYCTQLALAELLCSQELDEFTFSVDEDAADKAGGECAKEVQKEITTTEVEDAKLCDVVTNCVEDVNNEMDVNKIDDNCITEAKVNAKYLTGEERNTNNGCEFVEDIMEIGVENTDQEINVSIDKIDQETVNTCIYDNENNGNTSIHGNENSMNTSIHDNKEEDEEKVNDQTLIYDTNSKSAEGAEEERQIEIPLVDLSSGDETASTCSFNSNILNKEEKEMVEAERMSDLPVSDPNHSSKSLPENPTSSTLGSSLSTKLKNSESTMSALHSKLIYDWSCLLTNGDHSDTVILTSDGEIPVHFLVLSVRCPEMLKDLSEEDSERGNKKYINWTEVSYECAYSFVVYLYSGECTVKSKASDNWLALFDLSIKYKCTELVEYLESVYKSSPLKEITNQNAFTNTNTPLDNSKNENISKIFTNKRLRRSNVSVIQSQAGSPDIFGDWDSGEEARNFIDSPNVTPPGTNIRESLLKSLKSPVLNLDDSLPLLNQDDVLVEDEEIDNDQTIIYDTNFKSAEEEPQSEISLNKRMEEKNNLVEEKDSRFFAKGDEEKIVNTIVGNDSDILKLGDEIENSSHVEDPLHGRKEMAGIEETTSSPASKSVFRRNLSYKFKKLCSPPRNVKLCSPPRNIELCSPRNTELCSPLRNIELSSPRNTELCSARNIELSSSKNTKLSFPRNKELCSPLKHIEDCPSSKNIDLWSPSRTAKHCSPKNVELTSLSRYGEFSSPSRNRELCSPPRNRDSLSNETHESEKLQLSPFSDLNYPSGNEFVDLTISSDNSDSDECPKDPSNNPESSHSNKGEMNQDARSSIINSHSYDKVNDSDSTSRFSALLHKPIQNRFESGKQKIDGEINIPELSAFKRYPSVEKFVASKLAKEEHVALSSNGLTSKSKSHVLSSSELNRHNNFSENFSDESLLKAVCSLEDDFTTGKRRKTRFETPKHKFLKSKSCNISSSNTFLSPDKRNNMSTPTHKVNITPMPDYKTMLSPELKKELDKYGIRKLSRKKAVTLLLHIYDQMHPLVTDSEAETSFAETPLRIRASDTSEAVAEKKGCNKRTKSKGKITKANSSSDVDLNSSQTSNTSVESGFECLEETVYPDSQEESDAVTPAQQTSLENRIKTFIRSDCDLYTKILTYEPIWANELLKDLKLNGIKCGLAKLITFLDEQCITFRLPTRERTRKRPRKNSSPDKIPRKRKTIKTK